MAAPGRVDGLARPGADVMGWRNGKRDSFGRKGINYMYCAGVVLVKVNAEVKCANSNKRQNDAKFTLSEMNSKIHPCHRDLMEVTPRLVDLDID